MDLKIGDLVAFKKYEDMTDELKSVIAKEYFPEFGKVSTVYDAIDCFEIEEEQYVFGQDLIDYVIAKAATDDIHVGDEVLIKATIRKISGNHVSFSWVNNNKGDVVKVLKRKEEYFFVQEDHYGMYIGVAGELVGSKDTAQIFTSRDEANDKAADMHLNAWEVIPYDD